MAVLAVKMNGPQIFPSNRKFLRQKITPVFILILFLTQVFGEGHVKKSERKIDDGSGYYITLSQIYKMLKTESSRMARQEDGGEDGEDGVEEGVNAGQVVGSVSSTLTQFQQVIPQLSTWVTGLSQFNSAINQSLNGTDTPDLPSFLVKHGMQAHKFFQSTFGSSSSSSNNRRPAPVHRIPPRDPIPGKNPPQVTPPTDPYPVKPVEIDDADYYPDENVPQEPGVTQTGTEPSSTAGPTTSTSARVPEAEPNPKETSSLWNIYNNKLEPDSTRAMLTAFQLAHPDAFSNELLQSISTSFSSVRGPTAKRPSVPAEVTASEMFKRFYPSGFPAQPAIFAGVRRPTLSVYQPQTSYTPTSATTRRPAAPSKYEWEAITQTPPEESPPLPQNRPNPKPQYPPQRVTTTTRRTVQPKPDPDTPHYVRSPTSGEPVLPIEGYVPSIVTLHGLEHTQEKLGPLQNPIDKFNGFNEYKMPYTPTKGVLLEAARLPPNPLYQNYRRRRTTTTPVYVEIPTNAPSTLTSYPRYPSNPAYPVYPNKSPHSQWTQGASQATPSTTPAPPWVMALLIRYEDEMKSLDEKYLQRGYQTVDSRPGLRPGYRFPPGHPLFWMNNYYPNGIPDLNKIRASLTTTPKPKRNWTSFTLNNIATEGRQ